MTLSKRQGAFGIGAETVGGTVEPAPAYWLGCDSANIEFTPVVYNRVNSITENTIGIQQAGFEYSFSFSGAEVDCETLGYLLWLFYGDGTTDAITVPHTITSAYDSKYFTVFKHHGGEFDSTNDVERLHGCRFDSLSIDQQRASYAKVSGSGFGMTLTPLTTIAQPTLSLGAANAPLSWAALQAGDLQLGFNDAALATANDVTYVKIDLSRELSRAGADLSSNDPSQIIEGGRMTKWEVGFDLSDDLALAGSVIGAVKASPPHNVQLSANWTTSTTSLTFTTGKSRITNSPAGDIGTGTEAQQFTVQAEAFDDDATEVATVLADDDNATTYISRTA